MRIWAGLSLCLISSTAWAQAACEADSSEARQVLSGFMTRADFETYREVPFTVPSGTQAIHVQFDYDRAQRTTIDLGLMDPAGFRGWSGGNKQTFTLTAETATPSFQAGPLPEGQWRVLLGVPNIREDVESAYTLTVTLDCETRPDTRVSPADRGPDWYSGDLHTHNGHSDGFCNSLAGARVPCPPFITLQSAVNRGLDFIALTDHNSVSQNQQHEELRSYFDTVLLVPGREVTTFHGHANVFGSTSFIDFRVQPQAGRGGDFLLDQVEAGGLLLSINHPGLPSGEDCMGCGWVLPETDYSRVGAVEVVNGGSIGGSFGPRHIDFWQQRLTEGYRLTGIGGSDNHDPKRSPDEAGAVGSPTTWIFAQQLSVAAILDAIRTGNVYIDVTGSGLRLTEFGVAEQAMGATVALTREPLPLRLAWEGDESLRPRWIHQGHEVVPEQIRNESGRWHAFLPTRELTVPGWLRMDLIDDSGEIRLLGNPVYLEYALDERID